MPSLRSFVAPLLAGLLALVLAPTVAAQGLCQIHFEGNVLPPPVKRIEGEERQVTSMSGHLVEVEIGAFGPNGVRERDLVLHLHLANGTSAPDLAQLVAQRLERLGVRHLLARPHPSRLERTLSIEGARYVNLRLGGGLRATVSSAEGAPSALRVLPPSAIEQPVSLRVSASTALVLRDRPPIRKRASLALDLQPTVSAPEVATRLTEAAAGDWVAERPRGDSWRPVKMANGATITGVGIELTGSLADWRLELEL